MKDELKQPVLVENRPGAGGRIVAESMKNAPADGSVLMLTPVVVPVLAPMVFSKLPYDPAVDFAPVAHVANFQFALGVNGTHPAKSMKELVAWYKANPAKANFGSPAPGSLPHFFGLMIGKGAGIDLIHVPYNGGAPMMNGLMGDQVSSGIDTTVEMIELHRAGKIRILGTSGATRSPLLPDVPTLVESGLAGVEGTGWFAVYAPAKTPEADGAPAQRRDQQGARRARGARALHQARPRAHRRQRRRPGEADGRRHRALGPDRQGLGLQGRLSRRRVAAAR